MKNYIKILSLLVFIISLWIFNSFLKFRIDEDLLNLQKLQKQLLLKESFNNQSSPANLSKSIDEFVPEKFDKSQLTNLMVRFSQESSISIKSIDIQEFKSNVNNETFEDSDSKNVKIEPSSQAQNITSNNLKAISVTLNFSGEKKSIDLFLDKLVKSKQYIDINNITLSYGNSSLNSSEISGSIIAILYYKNL